MAIDVYLQIDGIKGESTDSVHQGWIECLSVEWAVTQPKSATASTAGGHTAERANLSEIGITKLADMASPILFQSSACGKTFPRAKLEFMRADGDGTPIKYFEIQLENVLICHMASSVSEGAVLGESLGLKFSKIKMAYTQQRIGGGTLGSTMGGWDLASNRIAA
ncbi:Hcp family type VI secretion system effector [Massilia yuzhufengensis]|uniref:Type VI secretion system secreted protein Hcp n=1 Tax=Massilia yuzhufengensis TaxID=1164594 RepID=A0A1I1UYG8_9BURK|nr:type VI secretion system tube protein Hcp [Massilia yuzhufengensis]SFD73883.1 type VI secretion system secreted protein Hcp [Massilia yuzhufengensis]